MGGGKFLGIVGNDAVVNPGVGIGHFVEKSVSTVIADGGIYNREVIPGSRRIRLGIPVPVSPDSGKTVLIK